MRHGPLLCLDVWDRWGKAPIIHRALAAVYHYDYDHLSQSVDTVSSPSQGRCSARITSIVVVLVSSMLPSYLRG